MNTILVLGAPDFHQFVGKLATSLAALKFLAGRHGDSRVDIRNRYFTCSLEFAPAASDDLSGQKADGYVLFAKPFKMPRKELIEESVVLAAPIDSKDKEFYLDEDGLMFEYTLTYDELAFVLSTAPYKHFDPLPDTNSLAQNARLRAQSEQDRSLKEIMQDLKDQRAREEIMKLRDAVRVMQNDSDESVEGFGAVASLLSGIEPHIKALPDSERRAAAEAVMLILGDTLDGAAKTTGLNDRITISEPDEEDIEMAELIEAEEMAGDSNDS